MRSEAGFTLIEMIVVTAIVTIVVGTLGTFFLAGATPAVASAARDVSAAFDEARRTAIAFDSATVVFTPEQTGSGYRARVYARVPGDAGFQARNGPDYASTVTISETASPLGAPAFAFAIDGGGTVTGYANFVAGAGAYVARACPPGGAFTLHLSDERDVRTVTIPCSIAPSAVAPLVVQTPPAAFVATPFPVATCPAGMTCSLAPVAAAPGGATCPSGYTPDPNVPGLCDAPPTAAPTQPASPPGGTASAVPSAAPSTLPTTAPTPAPAGTSAAISTPSPSPVDTPPSVPQPGATSCPAGFSGSAPACVAGIIEQYLATADGFAPHTSTLFADGSICDDYGCSIITSIGWTWACPFSGAGGSNGNDGSNYPYQPDNAFDGSVSSMIGIADHEAAEGDGDGHVATGDSYCAGYTLPHS